MKRTLIACVSAAVLILAACGDDSDTTSTAGQSSDTTVADTTTSSGDDTSSDAVASAAETPLGTTLVDTDGLTLYGFTPDGDADGTPTCTDACAEAWPPLLVDGADLPDGLDSAVFSVVERPDGDPQLKAGDWPLYRFAGDAAPGDVNGQGSGGSWFAVAPDGSLIEGTVAADGASSGDRDY